jgi:hypothetical protein
MRMPRFFAGATVVMLIVCPAMADAQGNACATPQAQCAIPGYQQPGAPCRCPAYPMVPGTVIAITPSLDPGPRQEYERPILRNDDLDDDDDVLRGPRHHPHRRYGGFQDDN